MNTLHENNVMHTHPVLGAVLALLTGAGGIGLMQLTQGVLSIACGVLSLALLIIQLRKACKSS